MANCSTAQELSSATGQARTSQINTASSTRCADPVGDDGCCLIVRNLPDEVAEMDLQPLFAGFGQLLRLDMPSAPTSTRTKLFVDRYATVAYEDPQHARCAMEQMDGKVKLDGALLELFVRPARAQDESAMGLQPQQDSRLSFCGLPAAQATMEEVVAAIRRFGRLCWIRMCEDGSGTAVMESNEAAAAAVAALDNTDMAQGKFRVGWADTVWEPASCQKSLRLKLEAGRSSAWDACRLYYHGIPRTVSPAAIAGVFGHFGEVVLVSPGCSWAATSAPAADSSGVVVMASEQSAKDAVARLHASFTWPGAERPLLVKPCVKGAASSITDGGASSDVSDNAASSDGREAADSISSRSSNSSRGPATKDTKHVQQQEQYARQAPPVQLWTKSSGSTGRRGNVYRKDQDHNTSYDPLLALHGHLPYPRVQPAEQYNYLSYCLPPAGPAGHGPALSSCSTDAVTWLMEAISDAHISSQVGMEAGLAGASAVAASCMEQQLAAQVLAALHGKFGGSVAGAAG